MISPVPSIAAAVTLPLPLAPVVPEKLTTPVPFVLKVALPPLLLPENVVVPPLLVAD